MPGNQPPIRFVYSLMLKPTPATTAIAPTTSSTTGRRRIGAFAATGLALALFLGACGDDRDSTTATDSSNQPPAAAAGGTDLDGDSDADTGLDPSTDSTNIGDDTRDDPEPTNAADGDSTTIDDDPTEPDPTNAADGDSTTIDDDPTEPDPTNAADGDDMMVDDDIPHDLGDDGLSDDGGAVDPAGGSTFNPVAGEWNLVSLTIEGEMEIDLEGGQTPTLSVEGNEITGTTGCNSFTVPVEYDFAVDSFRAGNGTMTEMACEDNDVERWFVQALSSVTTFNSEPGVLVLTDDAEFPTTMRFTIDLPAENPDEEMLQ